MSKHRGIKSFKFIFLDRSTNIQALEVDTSLTGATTLQYDNGPEFTSKALDQWAYVNNVTLHFTRAGKPTDNCFAESFNGRFREECLNANWFADLADARRVIGNWRTDYNDVRPHGSLDDRTPSVYKRDYINRLTQ